MLPNSPPDSLTPKYLNLVLVPEQAPVDVPVGVVVVGVGVVDPDPAAEGRHLILVRHLSQINILRPIYL